MTETLRWIDVSDEIPDESMVVLIATPNGDEPTWLGYIDGGAWHYNNGMRVDVAVTAWAELPSGPQPQGSKPCT